MLFFLILAHSVHFFIRLSCQLNLTYCRGTINSRFSLCQIWYICQDHIQEDHQQQVHRAVLRRSIRDDPAQLPPFRLVSFSFLQSGSF